MSEHTRLIAAGDAAWLELCALLDAAPPDAPLHARDSPAWTPRDVYTHFMRMHMWSADAVRRELAGLPLDSSSGSEDEVNARLQQEERHRTLDEARELAHTTRVTFRELMLNLTPAQWSTIGYRHADDLVGGHYRGHIQYID
ncbi:MAG: hypothetical protein O3B31_12095 [Chloroflexi bacterium]|nr:hypothetical protein [Chloroflexota bacterium]MDA1004065.1 hypothetical protein [Chloroflexota bacterium]